jgi:hypothetical protein
MRNRASSVYSSIEEEDSQGGGVLKKPPPGVSFRGWLMSKMGLGATRSHYGQGMSVFSGMSMMSQGSAPNTSAPSTPCGSVAPDYADSRGLGPEATQTVSGTPANTMEHADV